MKPPESHDMKMPSGWKRFKELTSKLATFDYLDLSNTEIDTVVAAENLMHEMAEALEIAERRLTLIQGFDAAAEIRNVNEKWRNWK